MAERQNDLTLATTLYEEAWARLEELEAPQDRAVAVHRIAAGFRDLGRLADAEVAGRLAVELEEKLGRTLLVGNHLGFLVSLLKESGRYEEALPLAERSFECILSELGEDHREVGYYASVVAQLKVLLETD